MGIFRKNTKQANASSPAKDELADLKAAEDELADLVAEAKKAEADLAAVSQQRSKVVRAALLVANVVHQSNRKHPNQTFFLL